MLATFLLLGCTFTLYYCGVARKLAWGTMTLRIGTQFGGYDVVAALGKGGMGEVWRVRDPKLNRDVALKASNSGERDPLGYYWRGADDSESK
jgi:hypothetical protein